MDCIHFKVCRDATVPNPAFIGPRPDKSKECRHFKNKVSFVEVISVKDVTEDYPISLDKVGKALASAQFGGVEIDLILRTLSKCNIAE